MCYKTDWLMDGDSYWRRIGTRSTKTHIDAGKVYFPDEAEILASIRYGAIKHISSNEEGSDMFFTEPNPSLFDTLLVEVKWATFGYKKNSKVTNTSSLKQKIGKNVVLIVYLNDPFKKMITELALPPEVWEARVVARNSYPKLVFTDKKNGDNWWMDPRYVRKVWFN